jgi:hypothetical protein
MLFESEVTLPGDKATICDISGFRRGVVKPFALCRKLSSYDWPNSPFVNVLNLEDGTDRLFQNFSNYQIMPLKIPEDLRVKIIFLYTVKLGYNHELSFDRVKCFSRTGLSYPGRSSSSTLLRPECVPLPDFDSFPKIFFSRLFNINFQKLSNLSSHKQVFIYTLPPSSLISKIKQREIWKDRYCRFYFAIVLLFLLPLWSSSLSPHFL